MSRFYISDTHFGHEKCVTVFKREDGSPLRDFASVEEMDETLIERWNKTVNPQDTIIHLGDVLINRRFFPLLHRLNGRKILVKGNHDIFKLKDYLPFFEDIRAYDSYRIPGRKRILFSHIPVHPDNMYRVTANVHGHTHSSMINDPRYINICVEHTNYTPVALEDLITRVASL